MISVVHSAIYREAKRTSVRFAFVSNGKSNRESGMESEKKSKGESNRDKIRENRREKRRERIGESRSRPYSVVESVVRDGGPNACHFGAEWYN